MRNGRVELACGTADGRPIAKASQTKQQTHKMGGRVTSFTLVDDSGEHRSACGGVVGRVQAPPASGFRKQKGLIADDREQSTPTLTEVLKRGAGSGDFEPLTRPLHPVTRCGAIAYESTSISLRNFACEALTKPRRSQSEVPTKQQVQKNSRRKPAACCSLMSLSFNQTMEAVKNLQL